MKHTRIYLYISFQLLLVIPFQLFMKFDHVGHQIATQSGAGGQQASIEGTSEAARQDILARKIKARDVSFGP